MPRLNVTNVTSSGTLQSINTFSSTEGFRLPSYATAQRPSSVPNGTMIEGPGTFVKVFDGDFLMYYRGSLASSGSGS